VILRRYVPRYLRGASVDPQYLTAIMRQIALPLGELRSGAADSLIITPANAAIFGQLGLAGDWPGRTAILIGPARSGKSLLARHFVHQQKGQVIDNAEIAGDEKLFNAWNRAQAGGEPLLLLSRIEPAKWQIKLPDLRSRLANANLLMLPPPDDEMLEHLLFKQLRARGTSVTPEVLSYIVKRIARSYAAVEEFAERANDKALAENSAITLALVKNLL
jgi:hypothetical protein